MNRHDHITSELSDLQSGLPHSNSNPQAVPPGYFDNLAKTILVKAKEADEMRSEIHELSPFLAGLPKSTPFTLPDGFFEEAVSGALAAVQDIEPSSTLLQPIGKAMPYTLPQGYFETLPSILLLQVAKPQGKVVPLFARTWMRVAAAAVVAGALFVAGLQFFGSKADIQTANSPATANSTLANVAPSLRQDIKQTSTKDIEDFVEAVQTHVSNTQKSVTDKAATDLLKDVSAKEMERFLSSMPSEEGLLTD